MVKLFFLRKESGAADQFLENWENKAFPDWSPIGTKQDFVAEAWSLLGRSKQRERNGLKQS